jgi:hypothetical protein
MQNNPYPFLAWRSLGFIASWSDRRSRRTGGLLSTPSSFCSYTMYRSPWSVLEFIWPRAKGCALRYTYGRTVQRLSKQLAQRWARPALLPPLLGSHWPLVRERSPPRDLSPMEITRREPGRNKLPRFWTRARGRAWACHAGRGVAFRFKLFLNSDPLSLSLSHSLMAIREYVCVTVWETNSKSWLPS